MLKEFKDFMARGNVVDLAVAVVLGAAFGTVVKAFTDGIITPLIGAVGDFEFSGWNAKYRDNTFAYGLVVDALIYFVIVAAVIFFFIVKPMAMLAERRRRGEEPKAAPQTDETILLTEIRDLLRQQQQR